MTYDSRTTVSRIAMMMAAGLVVGLMPLTAAKAADLGGNCCADLEERIAELEATTVRKGNKVVSLTLSGQVNRALLWYDDGANQRLTSVDNNNSSSRFRLQGDAKIAPGWSVGYYLEVELVTSNSFGTDQIESRRASNGVASGQNAGSAQQNGEGNSPLTLGLRQSHWYVKNDKLGTISIGRVNTASKDISGIDLTNVNVLAYSDTRLVGSELFTTKAGATGGRATLNAAGLGSVSTLRWSAFVPQIDSYRFDGVRYDSPTLYGFTLSLAAGDNARYDVAGRYNTEYNGVRLALGLSYTVDNDEGLINGDNGSAPGFTLNTSGNRDQRDFRFGGSVLHVPTGLFVNGFYLNREYNGTNGSDTTVGKVAGTTTRTQRPDYDYWWIAGGVSKNWFGFGSTSLYGEYAQGTDAFTGSALNLSTTTPGAVQGVNFAEITKSDVTIYGAGVVQTVNSAATDFYLGWRHFDADVAGITTAGQSASQAVKQGLNGTDVVMGGARIKF